MSRTARQAFVAGLTYRRWWIQLVGVAIAAGTVFAVRPGLVERADLSTQSLESALVRDGDDATWVAWRTRALATEARLDGHLILLGGSAIRECIPDGATLATDLVAAGGQTRPVENLGSSNQSWGQSLTVVDALPPGNSVLLLGTAVYRTGAAVETDEDQALRRRPLLLPGTALAEQMGLEAPDALEAWADRPTVGPVVWRGFQRLRALYRGTLTGKGYRAHQYTAERRLKTPTKRRRLESLVALAERLPEVAPRNLKLARATIALAQQKGYRVALLEHPRNRPLDPQAVAAAHVDYEARRDALAAELGVPVIDPGAEAGLIDDDFHDVTHLVEPGRVKFSKALAKALVAKGLVP